MKPRPWLVAVTALAAGGANAACGGSAPPPAPRTASAPPAPRLTGPVATRPRSSSSSSDEGIILVLIRELDADRIVGRERIDADCQNGILTLRGDVSAPLVKERAVAIARVVQGVRAIVDRIAVAARPRPDPELALLAGSALASDSVTASEPMGAHAHAGVVRLTGMADSNAARRIAEGDVLAVPGVVEVVDDLAVEPGMRTDAQVAREVGRILREDPWLDGSRVEEGVHGGVVTLVGYVKSAAERARAEDDALLGSPDGVNVVALNIVHLEDGTLRNGAPIERTDNELAAALSDAYALDPRVRPFVPAFEVRGGVAVLTGTAPDPDTARAAAEDARNVTGMTAAHDDLNVMTTTAQSDAAVLYEARGAFDRDPGLSARGLTVEVVHGRLALRGNVVSEAERRHAISVATSIRGVRGVDDDLLVDPPRLAR